VTHPVHAVEGVVVPGWERDQAVSQWLLCAATDRQTARREWAEFGVTALGCGLFSAVRLDGDLVHVAAGSTEPAAVEGFLRDTVHGPVFGDRHQRAYFLLAPASMAREARMHDRATGTAVLGRGSWVVVPRPGLTVGSPGPAWWWVPMPGPGSLCDPADVSQLVAYGQARILQGRGQHER